MLLSELIPKLLPEFEFEVTAEKPFDTLGLVGAENAVNRCTFIDRSEFIGEIPQSVSMVITKKEYLEDIKQKSKNCGICVTDNPRVLYFKLHNALSKSSPYARAEFDTQIGEGCSIHPTAIIAEKNVKIGKNVTICEYVVIRENTVIGDNCIIRSGVKLGEPDFEFKREGDTIFGVEHCGGVIIGKEVEILSNTGINRALYPWDDTVVGDYCKIDMLCNISHGAKIGDNTMVVALSGIGGRTVIGKNCWIGYGCIIRNGITIGDNARVNMGAVVTKNVEDNQAVSGNFAIDHDRFMEDLKNKAK